jgi:hypothetical protein
MNVVKAMELYFQKPNTPTQFLYKSIVIQTACRHTYITTGHGRTRPPSLSISPFCRSRRVPIIQHDSTVSKVERMFSGSFNVDHSRRYRRGGIAPIPLLSRIVC